MNMLVLFEAFFGKLIVNIFIVLSYNFRMINPYILVRGITFSDI